MEYWYLAKNITVSGQITESDVVTLKKLGVDTIVCNRPDGESSDQTAFATIKESADQQGLRAIFIPFVGNHLTFQHVEAFCAIFNQNRTIHMYCRTGHRCTMLWNMSQNYLQ